MQLSWRTASPITWNTGPGERSGLYVWIHDRAFHTYDKRGSRYADGCAFDVSEQKLYAELIERLQRRTELILDSAGEGIVGLDSNGRLTFANPAAARMLGSAPAELTGRDLHEVLRCLRTGGECARPNCRILGCLRDGKEHRGTDEIRRAAGEGILSVEYTSTPKFDNGQLSGAVVVFRDVTEARQAQERIQASA